MKKKITYEILDEDHTFTYIYYGKKDSSSELRSEIGLGVYERVKQSLQFVMTPEAMKDLREKFSAISVTKIKPKQIGFIFIPFGYRKTESEEPEILEKLEQEPTGEYIKERYGAGNYIIQKTEHKFLSSLSYPRKKLKITDNDIIEKEFLK